MGDIHLNLGTLLAGGAVPNLELLMRNPPHLLRALALTWTALLGMGCAQVPQLLAAIERPPLDLEARGPGSVFASIEATAIDALTWSYLQAREARTSERMRAGAIYRVGAGYSYSTIHVSSPWLPHRIRYMLEPRAVARFAIYPKDGNHVVDRQNERPSRVDRHSVDVTDPLHRPLYILHPSLAIREYRGKGHELVEVAHLPPPSRPPFFAGS